MNLINWKPKTVSSNHNLPNVFERMIDDNFFYDYDNINWTPSVDINESNNTFSRVWQTTSSTNTYLPKTINKNWKRNTFIEYYKIS